jgi:transcriptional regulator with XRE-family HTH domain
MRTRATIGDLLRGARETRHLSQRKLAKLVGLHHVTLCRFENNKRMPSDEALYPLAKVLGLDYDFLKTLKGAAA